MSAQPLVGLTTGGVDQGGRHRQPQIQLYSAYIRALEDLGMAPVLITPSHSAPSINALLDHCDGLVLTGGEDVDPKRYGQEPKPYLGSVSPARDEMEMTTLAAALQRDLPVLGICRGMQVLNVFLGGTLYQDIDAEWTPAVRHEQEGGWGARAHDVSVRGDSRLCEAIGADRIRINSFHHQAVKDVAPSLEVTATAEDGLVEGIESRDHEWVVGVQWHPERHEASAQEADPDRRLFAGFRAAVVATREAVRSRPGPRA